MDTYKRVVELVCKHCDGKGISSVEIVINAGDIVIPTDGSSMPWPLHKVLWCKESGKFKPVRVIAIKGDLLAVLPAHWDNFNECTSGEYSLLDPCLCWLEEYWGTRDRGIWILARHCRKESLEALSEVASQTSKLEVAQPQSKLREDWKINCSRGGK